MELNFYATLVSCVAVLLFGRFIIKRVDVLYRFSIPVPVVGGIIVAIILLILKAKFDISIKFDESIKEPLMLAFFTSIGLSADFSSLKKGGKILVIFLILVSIDLFLQNIIGISIATILGVNPLLGLLGGSVTMVGGHGTGAAWGDIFFKQYGFTQAKDVAMACATFGLVMGGIIGGPVARYLIKKNNLKPEIKENKDYEVKETDYKDESLIFEMPKKEKLITAESFVESLALIAISLLIGTQLYTFAKGTLFELPNFVWCLFLGVIIRNGIQALKIHKVFDREVSVIGNVSLSLFLALALMTINLIDLVSLAVPILVILSVQVVLMALFAIFVTFRFMGRDYDAAVLSAGHCGFGLGAMPTCIVNMQTITQHYGPSHMAFIIAPLVGAFFVDLVNAIAIKLFLMLPMFNVIAF
ncbi:MAG: sodium/glutamate symporter [Helicobacteraceae bacterium]|nr:sodium/glutamate symporter [Helicobacteraceae bacterium]